MKTKKNKRKFFLVLPLLVLPFITLAFWALGGGRTTEETKASAGLNINLPDAKIKDDRNADKLSFYNQADKDSLKREEALRNDPNFTFRPDTVMSVLHVIPHSSIQEVNPAGPTDASERKIYTKINELNRQINQPSAQLSQSNSPGKDFSDQVDKLQTMMKGMTAKSETDSETVQLSGMMDKILDIQHPDRVKEKIKENSTINKQQVFPVTGSVVQTKITLLNSKSAKEHNSFYELYDENVFDTVDHSIEAVVHETQTVVSGSVVKLRLLTDVYVNGTLIPKGNFIYGTSALENERLGITINSIRYLNNLLPVALRVYDMDGLAGIYIPGSISGDVAKESAQTGLQQIDISTIDPSVAAQVTGVGINAAKNLLSRKTKLVKVTVKAGYKVLLNNKSN